MGECANIWVNGELVTGRMIDHVTNRDARPRAVAAVVSSFTHLPLSHSRTYSRIRTFTHSLIATGVLLASSVGVVAAQTVQMADQPGTPASVTIPALKGVGVDQKLNAQVPIDLTFVDETGKDVVLGQYFGKRPVVLALVVLQLPDAVLAGAELAGGDDGDRSTSPRARTSTSSS